MGRPPVPGLVGSVFLTQSAGWGGHLEAQTDGYLLQGVTGGGIEARKPRARAPGVPSEGLWSKPGLGVLALAILLELLGSGFGEVGAERVGAVHIWEHAPEGLAQHRSAEAPPQAGKPRPMPPSSSSRLRLWPGQCGAGAGLCVAATRPSSVPLETWTPREPSSTRLAPSKVQAGDRAELGCADQAVTSGWMQPPAGQRSGSAAPGQLWGWGAGAAENSGPCPARAPPGVGSGPELSKSSRSPAAGQ